MLKNLCVALFFFALTAPFLAHSACSGNGCESITIEKRAECVVLRNNSTSLIRIKSASELVDTDFLIYGKTIYKPQMRAGGQCVGNWGIDYSATFEGPVPLNLDSSLTSSSPSLPEKVQTSPSGEDVPFQSAKVPSESVQAPSKSANAHSESVHIPPQRAPIPEQNVQAFSQRVEIPFQDMKVPPQAVQARAEYTFEVAHKCEEPFFVHLHYLRTKDKKWEMVVYDFTDEDKYHLKEGYAGRRVFYLTDGPDKKLRTQNAVAYVWASSTRCAVLEGDEMNDEDRSFEIESGEIKRFKKISPEENGSTYTIRINCVDSCPVLPATSEDFPPRSFEAIPAVSDETIPWD